MIKELNLTRFVSVLFEPCYFHFRFDQRNEKKCYSGWEEDKFSVSSEYFDICCLIYFFSVVFVKDRLLTLLSCYILASPPVHHIKRCRQRNVQTSCEEFEEDIKKKCY